MDHPDGVVGGLVGCAPEYRLALAHRHELGADEGCDRRRREVAVDDRLEELSAGQFRSASGKKRWVVPADGLASRRSPRVAGFPGDVGGGHHAGSVVIVSMSIVIAAKLWLAIPSVSRRCTFRRVGNKNPSNVSGQFSRPPCASSTWATGSSI